MDQTAQALVPTLEVDPYDRATLLAPYDYYEALREAGAVVYLPKYDVYATGRHDEVCAILQDWQTYCSSRGVGLSDFSKEKPWRDPSVLIESDPPRHNEVRKVILRILSKRALAELAEMLAREAEAVVDRLLEQRRFDACRDLVQAYLLKVFGDAVGVDETGREHLVTYGDVAFNSFGPLNEHFHASIEKSNSSGATQWVMDRCKQEALRPGGFGAKVYEYAREGNVTEYEAWNLVRALLSAGVDTTIAGIAHMLLCLARNPDQYDLLVAEPGRAGAAFDEAVRHDPPIHSIFRTTTRPVSLSGIEMGEGQKVLASIGAASRDPRRWDDPAKYDLTRDTAGHVGFGSGVHLCIGMNVARIEAEALTRAFVARVKRIELDGEPVYKANNSMRSLAALPVSVVPR